MFNIFTLGKTPLIFLITVSCKTNNTGIVRKPLLTRVQLRVVNWMPLRPVLTGVMDVARSHLQTQANRACNFNIIFAVLMLPMDHIFPDIELLKKKCSKLFDIMEQLSLYSSLQLPACLCLPPGKLHLDVRTFCHTSTYTNSINYIIKRSYT
jgi:hypothetical protein